MNATALVGKDILARRSVRGQAAAAQQLIEAGQPAETAVRGGRHKTRMNRTGDGRFPAEEVAAILAAPKPHTARRDHRERESAIVDLDQVDAVAQAAAQG